jgi:hypothetical protein
MNKEMAEKAEQIVERHVNELMLQLDNMSLTDDQYIGVVDTLGKLMVIQTIQVTLKVQKDFIREIGD